MGGNGVAHLLYIYVCKCVDIYIHLSISIYLSIFTYIYISYIYLHVQVMGGNGVAHMLVNDDLEAVHKIVQWLGFVPEVAGGPLPYLAPADPVERSVDYMCETYYRYRYRYR